MNFDNYGKDALKELKKECLMRNLKFFCAIFNS